MGFEIARSGVLCCWANINSDVRAGPSEPRVAAPQPITIDQGRCLGTHLVLYLARLEQEVKGNDQDPG